MGGIEKSGQLCVMSKKRCLTPRWATGLTPAHAKTSVGQSLFFTLSIRKRHQRVENRGMKKITLATAGNVYTSSLPSYNISSLRAGNRICVIYLFVE